MADEQFEPRILSFSQKYGYEARPKPMQLEELSNGLRQELWNLSRRLLLEISSEHMHRYFAADARKFVEQVLASLMNCLEEDVDTEHKVVFDNFKKIILHWDFHRVLSFVELIVNDKFIPESFAKDMEGLFVKHAAAYRLDTSKIPYQFFPCASKEQGDAIQRDIAALRENDMNNAANHFRDAAGHINAQQYPHSISDSIMAVESVTRQISPKENTLGKALGALKKSELITNEQLIEGFKKLYAYSNEEEGIRHALVFQNESDPGLDEAVFMFGACASFCAYIVSKQNQLKEK